MIESLRGRTHLGVSVMISAVSPLRVLRDLVVKTLRALRGCFLRALRDLRGELDPGEVWCAERCGARQARGALSMSSLGELGTA